jgi:uncharacterized membrane protein (DUF106 family)
MKKPELKDYQLTQNDFYSLRRFEDITIRKTEIQRYLRSEQFFSLIVYAVVGFIPFFIMFWIIYGLVGKSVANKVLFWLYFVVWSMYGVVYLLDEETKQILTNLLDLMAKCFIGLGLWAYYTQIIR